MATISEITGIVAPITPTIDITRDTTNIPPATLPVTTSWYARFSRTRRGV